MRNARSVPCAEPLSGHYHPELLGIHAALDFETNMWRKCQGTQNPLVGISQRHFIFII